MAAAMAVMLLPRTPRAAVLALGVRGRRGWPVGGSRPARRAAYVRLGIGCAAMAAMLVPAATLAAAAASGPRWCTRCHDHDHAPPPHGPTPLALPLARGGAAVALVAVLVVARLLGSYRGGAAAGRLDAGCEVLMGVAMAEMLAAFLGTHINDPLRSPLTGPAGGATVV